MQAPWRSASHSSPWPVSRRCDRGRVRVVVQAARCGKVGRAPNARAIDTSHRGTTHATTLGSPTLCVRCSDAALWTWCGAAGCIACRLGTCAYGRRAQDVLHMVNGPKTQDMPCCCMIRARTPTPPTSRMAAHVAVASGTRIQSHLLFHQRRWCSRSTHPGMSWIECVPWFAVHCQPSVCASFVMGMCACMHGYCTQCDGVHALRMHHDHGYCVQ